MPKKKYVSDEKKKKQRFIKRHNFSITRPRFVILCENRIKLIYDSLAKIYSQPTSYRRKLRKTFIMSQIFVILMQKQRVYVKVRR